MKSNFLALAVLAISVACQTGANPRPKLAPEERARLAQLWSLYQEKDPSWAARRDAAMETPLDREFLTQNLVREIVRGADEAKSSNLAFSPRAARASEELRALGAASVPLLVALFPAKDTFVAEVSARVLAGMGETAVPGLAEASVSADPSTRRWSLLAFSWMQPPREEGRVVAALRDAEWSVRGAAAQALCRFPGMTAEKAIAGSLRDADSFVRRQAAEALATRGASEQIPALIRYLYEANGRLAKEETETALSALWALSRKNFGADPKRWQEWWEESKRNP